MHNVQERGQPIQPETEGFGLDNYYCNCLAICRYFLENLSQLWINSIYCTHVILFKSLIIVLGLFGLCILTAIVP